MSRRVRYCSDHRSLLEGGLWKPPRQSVHLMSHVPIYLLNWSTTHWWFLGLMSSIDAMVCMRSSASLRRSIYAAAIKSPMCWNAMPDIMHSLSPERQKTERGNHSLRDCRSPYMITITCDKRLNGCLLTIASRHLLWSHNWVES